MTSHAQLTSPKSMQTKGVISLFRLSGEVRIRSSTSPSRLDPNKLIGGI